MKECGDCGLCCKLIGVAEIGKPARQWCPHWNKKDRCTIYEDRPDECRNFNCLWLIEELPDRLRPKKTRVVAMKDNQGGVVLFSDLKTDPIGLFAKDIGLWLRRKRKVA